MPKYDASGISIINTINRKTPDGQPRGHYVATINSYIRLFSGRMSVQLITPPLFRSHFSISEITPLPNLSDSDPITFSTQLLNRVWQTGKTCKQILSAMKKTRFKTVFFPSPDPSFFLLFPLLKLIYPRTRFLFNAYTYQPAHHPTFIMRSLMTFAYRFATWIFLSDPSVQKSNIIYIPDYLYDPEFYSPYFGHSKANQVLIIGGLSLQEKEILEAIEVLGKAGLSAVIAGPTPKESDLKLMQEAAGPYPTIQLKFGYLPTDEFYSLIAQSKYVLLPYRKSRYLNRSSGVILEAAYLNTVVIAPHFLLDHSNVPGIGYDDISEIPARLSENTEKVLDLSQIQSENLFSTVQNRILNRLVGDAS